MSIIRQHRNNNCGDIRLFKKNCSKVMNNCEKHCGMPGLDSSITSDGSRDKPGCQLNAKGKALYEAYKKVEYPTHTYKLNGRQLTVDLKKAAVGPKDLAILFNKRRGGMLSNNDYEKLKEWREALREELRRRGAFDRECVWKINDMKSYTTPGWNWWRTNFPGNVPNQDIDLTATGHQNWKDNLNSKIDKISRFIGRQEQEELDAAAKAAAAAAAKAAKAAAKMKQKEKNNRDLVEKAAGWMLENTLDDVFTTSDDKTIKLVTKVENDQIIMLAITLILLSHGLGIIEPEEGDRPRRSKRHAGKPADQDRPLQHYLGITPPPRDRDRAVYHRLAKPKESPMDSFHTYTRVDKPLGVTATVSPNSRITDPLVIYVKYQQNNAKKQVVKTVLLTLLIRLKIAELGAAKKGMTRQEILEQPENNHALWEQEIFSAIAKLHDEDRLIEDPVGELGRALNVNPEQLFLYALSDKSLYHLYRLSRAKIPKFIFPTAATRVDRITNIEFNTSDNSSQRIIDQLYNLFDNTLKKLTEGSGGKALTLEQANEVRETMAKDNVINARDALRELEKMAAADAQEELRNQLFDLAVCSLAAAQESWLNIIYDEPFIEQLNKLEAFASTSHQKTETIKKFIQQAREPQAKVEAEAKLLMAGVEAVDLEAAEAVAAAAVGPEQKEAIEKELLDAQESSGSGTLSLDLDRLKTAINKAEKAAISADKIAVAKAKRDKWQHTVSEFQNSTDKIIEPAGSPRGRKSKSGQAHALRADAPAFVFSPRVVNTSNSSLGAAQEPSADGDLEPSADEDLETAVMRSLFDR